MPYCIYLRKSRADIEAEQHGEGETLARHEKLLTDLACRLQLCVTNIYREIVSGETIAARPVMQQLLREVEFGKWEGVLVVEVERLARGDTMDQGQVAKSFKLYNTKIVTPSKTYDPGNEFDEEYFEFGLFMSRREYKTINRRLQRGRLASVKEGKIIYSTAPYGYRKVKISNDKGYTLEIIPSEATVVKMIYDLYANGIQTPDGSYSKMGVSLICKQLDSLGIKPKHKDTWAISSIRDILKNPIYIGKVRWQWKKETKWIDNGILKKSRTKSSQYMIFDGIHQAIIDESTFQTVQNLIEKNRKTTVTATKLRNPLTGLVYCKKCGQMMTRMCKNSRNPYDTLKCPNTYCNNVSSPLYLVEKELLQSLADWVQNFRFQWKLNVIKDWSEEISIIELSISASQEELQSLKSQYNKTFEFLEKGVYSTEVFMQRNTFLNEQIGEMQNKLNELSDQLKKAQKRSKASAEIIPKIETILDVYPTLNVTQKNSFLKDVLEKVIYVKYEKNTRNKRDIANFVLEIFPYIH